MLAILRPVLSLSFKIRAGTQEITKSFSAHDYELHCSDMKLCCHTMGAAFIQKYSRMSCYTGVFTGYLGTKYYLVLLLVIRCCYCSSFICKRSCYGFDCRCFLQNIISSPEQMRFKLKIFPLR